MGLPLRGWVVTGILSLSSAGAMAADSKVSYPPCTTAPTEADRNTAKTAFQAGQNSFNEADYATAITYWRDAYKRDCTAHALLLNIARAFELKGDRAEAITSLETYLQRKPDAGDGEQVKRRIDNLKAQQASSAPIPAPSATAPVPTTTATGPTPPPPVPDTGRHGHNALPLVLFGGAGGILVILGAVSIPAGAAKVSDAENTLDPVTGKLACPNRMCDLKAHPDYQQLVIDKGNEGRSQELIGGIAVGLGVASIATGLIWFLSSGSSGSSAQASHGIAAVAKSTSVAPSVSPSFAGFSLAGRF